MRGILRELDRLAGIRELDAYLAELEAEFGPPTAQEQTEARQWADRILGPADENRLNAW